MFFFISYPSPLDRLDSKVSAEWTFADDVRCFPNVGSNRCCSYCRRRCSCCSRPDFRRRRRSWRRPGLRGAESGLEAKWPKLVRLLPDSIQNLPDLISKSALPIIWKILMDVNSDLFTCFFLDLYWISALIMQVTCRIQLTCRENSDSQENFIQPSIIISFSFDKPIRNLNVSYMLIYIRFTWILKLLNKNHETSTCFLAVSCR